MTYSIRKSNERAFFDHGWLKTYHTFSFGSFYDPRFMGFHSLRVINEDRVAPNEGFPAHSHRNMEIITYVIEGALAHKDSTGTESIIHQNELQLMHAGTGITHSEYNPSSSEPVHFLQIWLLPDEQEVKPGYQQMLPKLKKNALTLVASKDGHEGSLVIHQDAQVYLAEMQADASLKIPVKRAGWLQVISGSFLCNNMPINQGDGMAIDSPSPTPGECTLTCKTAGKILFFDL